MSHVPGGLVYKRFLNALRPVDGGPPPPAICADGPVWTAIVPPTQLPGANGLFPLARGAERFVRVGRSVSTPTVFEYQYSTDGSVWIDGADVVTPVFDQPTSRTNNLVYGNGRFFQRVANFQFMRSVDEGLTFQTVNTASGSFPNMRNGIAAFVAGQFFMLGDTAITRSVDVSNNASFSEPVINGLVGNIVGIYEWNGDIYLTAGPTAPTPNSGRLYVSSDGGATFNWTGVFQPWESSATAPCRIAASPTARCGIGFNAGGSNGGFYTLDGQNWNPSIGTSGSNRIETAYQQGVFMMVSPSNEFPLISADNGATFTASPNSMQNASGSYCLAVDGVNVTVGTMSDSTEAYKRGVC